MQVDEQVLTYLESSTSRGKGWGVDLPGVWEGFKGSPKQGAAVGAVHLLDCCRREGKVLNPEDGRKRWI